MMPDKQEVLILARRTRENLEYIKKKKCQGAPVNEFTQLLNSMLCMVISLREEYIKGNHVSWEYVEGLDGLQEQIDLRSLAGKLDEKRPKLQQVDSFNKLIKNLRHAFAHQNFRLIPAPDGSNEIAGVTVWNIPPELEEKGDDPKNYCWETDITEKQLIDLAYTVVAYVEKIIK